VLDVGSNTVHLLVVDAHPGARPIAAAKVRTELHLTTLFSDDDKLSADGANRLVSAVAEARAAADELGVEDLAAFATSALRQAANANEVLSRVREESGLEVDILDGDDEARLTFLAVRRWFGWAAGRLLVMDIGGGSLEIATGIDEEPEAVASLPMGAARLTRDWLHHDPPQDDELSELRKFVRVEVARALRPFTVSGPSDLAVGTSKTMRSLARIAGAAPYSEGPYVPRALALADVRQIAGKLAKLPASRRAKLPGVSESRAAQLLAGAIVAETAMDLLGVDEVAICPWALREGVILRRLDWVEADLA
jgi:exopolyphosphatase/guanosine-5'-triphosphate,3'-diphosphate pyrophosphatase